MTAAPRITSADDGDSTTSETIIVGRIDGEMTRLDNKSESEAELLLRQQTWNRMEPTLPSGFAFDEDFSFDWAVPATVAGFTSGVDREEGRSSPRRRKDERMAEDDPMRYCANQCVNTGNCDVFEVRK